MDFRRAAPLLEIANRLLREIGREYGVEDERALRRMPINHPIRRIVQERAEARFYHHDREEGRDEDGEEYDEEENNGF